MFRESEERTVRIGSGNRALAISGEDLDVTAIEESHIGDHPSIVDHGIAESNEGIRKDGIVRICNSLDGPWRSCFSVVLIFPRGGDKDSHALVFPHSQKNNLAGV